VLRLLAALLLSLWMPLSAQSMPNLLWQQTAGLPDCNDEQQAMAAADDGEGWLATYAPASPYPLLYHFSALSRQLTFLDTLRVSLIDMADMHHSATHGLAMAGTLRETVGAATRRRPCLVLASEQGDTLWTHTLRRWNNAWSTACRWQGDCLYVCGYTLDSLQQADSWLACLSVAGDTLWTRTYDLGNGQSDWLFDLDIAQDGRLAMAGEYATSANSPNALLLVAGADGDTLWCARPGGATDAYSRACAMDADGGVWWAVNRHSTTGSEFIAYLQHYGAQGEYLASAFLQGEYDNYVWGIHPGADGPYCCGSCRNANLPGTRHGLLWHVNNEAQTLWSQAIPLNDNLVYRYIETSPAYGLLVSGVTIDLDTGKDICLASVGSAMCYFTAEPISGYVPLTVQFHDASSGFITARQWDFQADGVIDSEEQDPTFTYAQPGTYSVRLTVTGSPNDVNELERPDCITVNDVDLIDGWMPADTVVCIHEFTTLAFSVQPHFAGCAFAWYLNGVLQPCQDSTFSYHFWIISDDTVRCEVSRGEQTDAVQWLVAVLPLSVETPESHPPLLALANPLCPGGALQLSLPSPGLVELVLYDIRGRRVRALCSGSLSGGEHSLVWDGRADDGRRCATGVYLARLRTAGHTLVRRFVLLR